MHSVTRTWWLLSLTVLAACGDREPSPPSPVPVIGPCAVALTPHSGDGEADREIARLQDRARNAREPAPYLDRLGWAFIAKARRSYDAGFYRLAEQSALCLESNEPGSPAALLLRGHVLHQLHRFQEAEIVARRLVADRGLHYDYALLGDVLMEQGRLLEAADAYQEMIDQRPSPQAYGRAAHLRWLKGDVDGARELMQAAVQGQGRRDREAAAWSQVRLASYQLHSGSLDEGRGSIQTALALQPDYPPALLVHGRLLMAEGRHRDAVASLRRAAETNPLPEHQWALLEALRAAGDEKQAAEVESRLLSTGAAEDPRALSLFLATRGIELETARRLAEEELQKRTDVFTLDAVAWALQAAGQAEEARRFMARALAEGTRDARLFLHAGVIARKAGRSEEAARWFAEATALEPMLLPSERELLHEEIAAARPQRILAAS